MNHRTTRRDLETELHRFVQANKEVMTEEALALLTDVHSLLVHRTGALDATARQRDALGAEVTRQVTRVHALRLFLGDLPALELPSRIQRDLDGIAATVRAIGGNLAAAVEAD